MKQKCEMFSVNRSSLYYKPKARSNAVQEVHLMNRIREIYEKRPIYGYRRMHAVLRKEGNMINRKRARRLMRLCGLMAVYPKRNTSIRNKEHKIHPYLLRDMLITHANQVWCTDITYIKIKG